MALPTASDNAFPKVIIAEGSAPASPSAGQFKLYVDSADHLLKYKNSSGTVVTLGAGIADQGTVSNYIDYTEVAAPSTPSSSNVRLYAKSDGLLYSKDDAGTETLVSGGSGGGGGGTLTGARYNKTSGTYTTTSSTFTDIDGTNMSLTITTGAHRVLLTLTGACHLSALNSAYFTFAVDGTDILSGATYYYAVYPGNSTYPIPVSVTYLTDVLSAGSHTFKARYKSDGATLTFPANSGEAASFAVMETAIAA